MRIESLKVDGVETAGFTRRYRDSTRMEGGTPLRDGCYRPGTSLAANSPGGDIYRTVKYSAFSTVRLHFAFVSDAQQNLASDTTKLSFIQHMIKPTTLQVVKTENGSMRNLRRCKDR